MTSPLLAYAPPHHGFTISVPVSTRPTPHAIYVTGTDYVDLFNKHLNKWKNDAVGLSSISDQMSLPSFLAIVAMGDRVIPLILSDIKKDPTFIFMALRGITKVNPIPTAARGLPREMIRAWLVWGAENNYAVD